MSAANDAAFCKKAKDSSDFDANRISFDESSGGFSLDFSSSNDMRFEDDGETEEDADDEENLMPIANKLLDNKDLFHNDHKDSIMKFYDNAKRDENDRNRFYKLYTKENYYKNLNFYDCIIDTTNIIEKEKIKLCKDSFENWLFQNEYM